MKKFKFKVLQDGDSLYSFNGLEMTIEEANGGFRVYKIYDFDQGNPCFSKNFEKVVNSSNKFNDKAIIIEKLGKIVIYKIEKFENKIPVINEEFVILIDKGIGKVEMYDSKTQISYKLLAKEG